MIYIENIFFLSPSKIAYKFQVSTIISIAYYLSTTAVKAVHEFESV